MLRIWLNKYRQQVFFASDHILEKLLLEANAILDQKEVADMFDNVLVIRRLRNNIYREMDYRKFKYALHELDLNYNYTDRFSRIRRWIEDAESHEQGTSSYRYFSPQEVIKSESGSEATDYSASTVKVTEVNNDKGSGEVSI
ncbi:hypothetical protein GWI33_018345 [Rhynchophorus ferrugineus]|uniref:Uncharacterized protein n=1 Tax=Rhynchophorus ferrugineus TaxID=354439 RepID=A0A834M830_RHYFE|nr:hypothetical protein GWI33_018345 [Rhynchophorus ferrugineus]